MATGTGFIKAAVTASVTLPPVTLTAGDVEIGAVELKNATDDTRAKIGATAAIAEGDNVVGVQAPVLGATAGAALDADGPGTLQQYQRGLLKAFLARIPSDPAKESGVLTTINGKITACNTGAVIVYSQQQLGVGAVVAIGAASALSTQLAIGRYRMSGNGDCWFIQGTNAVVAIANTAGHAFLGAGSIDEIVVTDIAANGYIACIRDGAQAGYLSITKK